MDMLRCQPAPRYVRGLKFKINSVLTNHLLKVRTPSMSMAQHWASVPSFPSPRNVKLHLVDLVELEYILNRDPSRFVRVDVVASNFER